MESTQPGPAGAGRTTLCALLLPALLLLVTLALYSRTSGFEFVSHDDPTHIYENEFITEQSLENILHFWREPYKGLYIPLSYTLWSAQAWLAKVEPLPGQQLLPIQRFRPSIFHWVNVVCHSANVLLVFFLLRLLTLGSWAAFLGALLFSVHPVQVESVAWISEMKGLLAGLFTLLAILIHLLRLRSLDGQRRRILIASSLLAFLLALLAKPMSVIAPFLAFVLATASGQQTREAAKDLLPWLAILVPFILLAKAAQPKEMLNYITPLTDRPFVALDALAFYLGKLVWPVNLGIDYGRTPTFVLARWWGYATWTIPAAAAALLWWRRRRLSWLAAPFALFCLGFLPVLGLVPFHHQDISTVTDRYMYLPMLGPVFALARLAERVTLSTGALLASIIVPLLILSAGQLDTWRSFTPMYENAVRINPDSFLALKMLGFIAASEGRTREAKDHFEKALRVNPSYTPARLDLGKLLGRLGRHADAGAQFETVLRKDPHNREARMGLAASLFFLGRRIESAAVYSSVLADDPNDSRARGLLGQVIETGP